MNFILLAVSASIIWISCPSLCPSACGLYPLYPSTHTANKEKRWEVNRHSHNNIKIYMQNKITRYFFLITLLLSVFNITECHNITGKSKKRHLCELEVEVVHYLALLLNIIWLKWRSWISWQHSSRDNCSIRATPVSVEVATVMGSML